MKVIAVCGSPRRGNTEWMLQNIIERLKQGGAETELLLLRRMNVKRCTGCPSLSERWSSCGSTMG